MHVYETKTEPVEHLALVKGDLSAPGPVLVRVHAVNALADLLGIGAEGAAGLADREVDAHHRRGRPRRDRADPRSAAQVGVRPGSPKARSSKGPKKADAERRLVEIGVGSQILRDLGVADMVLLSNAPPSRYVGLEAFGLRIVGQRRIG